MRIGEIVETNSMGFVAESFELNQPPALGSLVVVEPRVNGRVYAVVAYGETSSIEPGRRAIRRGTDEVYDAAVYDEHPQIRRTLRTIFRALFVGWERDGQLRQTLPPQPPPLHYSVRSCDSATVCRFTERLYYLRLLLATQIEMPIAQLIIAHVSETYRLRHDDVWLETVARELATLLKDDNPTLMNILYAIDPG